MGISNVLDGTGAVPVILLCLVASFIMPLRRGSRVVLVLAIVLLQSTHIYSVAPVTTTTTTTILDNNDQPVEAIEGTDTLTAHKDGEITETGTTTIDDLPSVHTKEKKPTASHGKHTHSKHAGDHLEKRVDKVQKIAAQAIEKAERAEHDVGVQEIEAGAATKHKIDAASSAIGKAIDHNGNSLESSDVQKVIDQATKFAAPDRKSGEGFKRFQNKFKAQQAAKEAHKSTQKTDGAKPPTKKKDEQKLAAVDTELKQVHRQMQAINNLTSTFTIGAVSPVEHTPSPDSRHHVIKPSSAVTVTQSAAAKAKAKAQQEQALKTITTSTAKQVLSPAPTPEDEHPDLNEPSPGEDEVSSKTANKSIKKAASNMLWIALGMIFGGAAVGALVYYKRDSLPGIGIRIFPFMNKDRAKDQDDPW